MTDGADVPLDADLCRFVPWDKWDMDQNLPMASAFRASNRQLSVWEPEAIEDAGDSLTDLCIDGLSGAGHAMLRAEEFIKLGGGAPNIDFSPSVVWRPHHVRDQWAKWAVAHAQVETDRGDKGFPQTYRMLLAQTCRIIKQPERNDHDS